MGEEKQILDINNWALKYPHRVFDKDFTKQRQHLTKETWKAVILANPDMLDSASPKWRHIPNADIVNKYQGQAFSGEVRKAINEDGVKVAGLTAAVPGAIIGGGALAKPVLSLMFYHPGTFFAETIGGAIEGYAGGAATDAITRGVSDYDSFANMIASNSTIPELYAEMLNPGMLLGGLAGGVGGNVLYNNIVKPAAQKAAFPYLTAMLLNKNIRNANFNQGKYFHGSPSKNIKKFNIGKDGGIFFTTDKSAAKQYTGTFGQGKVYNVDLDLGDNIITIDNNGMPWTKIDEDKISTAFNIPKKLIHDIIGSYNLGAEPWYSGFLRPFGWRPEKNYYAIDLVVKLGKEKGIDSLIINNAVDNGKRLFSKNKIYDLTIIFNPDQIKTPKLTTNAFDDAVLLGKVGWSPKLNVVFKHGSENPNLQTFIPYETWDVKYRGASPYKYFVTEHGSPHNMMDERPFLYVGLFDLEKPIVLIGEFNVNGAKNTTRNQLVQEARNRGADSYYMKGIYDNKADDQNVIIKFIDNEGETPYMGLTSKSSTLTEAERLGIPKGERNLPYVEGYRKRHPEDIVVNVEKEKKQIIDLFNKPIYRDRLLADGYTELEIDDFVKNQILFLDRLKKAPAAISKNVPSDANGIALVDHIRLHHYDPEVALHEFGHLSEYPTFFFDNLLPKITKTSLIYGGPYYKEPGEVRTRALGVLLWLDQHGTTLDDFYKIVSDRAHSDKWWSTLNERAKEFLFAYPEDLGRNYLLHFRKQGGIINYLNLFK